MKETQKKIYKAFDGREFLTERDCIDYERKEQAKLKVQSSAKNIVEYCKENIVAVSFQDRIICNNYDCPFFDNKIKENCILGYPYAWKI